MQSKIAFGNRSQRVSRIRPTLSAWRLLPCLALIGSLGLPGTANAQTPLVTASVVGGIEDPQDPPATPAANAGPVRLARFAYLLGDVTWRSGADGSWSAASRNMPLRQGTQIWVADTGRAEVQFDDGSRLRLDRNSLVTLQTLYSDAEGEFTEITLNEGEVYLRLNNKFSLYQVNTPQSSLKATGPARLRVGGGEGAQFVVRSGSATIEGAGGKATLNAGDYLDVVDETSAYQVIPAPRADVWDAWNARRDQALDDPAMNGSKYLPSNIALVADDLGTYGTWHNDPKYGWVWSPRGVEAGWRPYQAGHWTWVEPFGWTWVSTENWGWAPYHYGTWVSEPYGWAWVPGPTTQYWSPGVVSFTENAGVVAWCPLAPAEVHYPATLSLGFSGGNWGAFFSIGGAAVYYPAGAGYCEPRPFTNVFVNRVSFAASVNVTNVTVINNVNISVNHNTYLTNARFVPVNAGFQGGTQVQAEGFGGRGAYQPVAAGATSVFAQGKVITAPATGRPLAGPPSVRVTAQSLTPTRAFQPPTQLPAQYVNRPVYRAPLPSNVPRAQSMPLAGQHFTTHPGAAGNGSRSTSTAAPAKSGGSGLDAYLRDREAAKNGGAGSTPGTGTGTKLPTAGGKDDTATPARPGGNGTNSGTSKTNATNPSKSTADSYRPLHDPKPIVIPAKPKTPPDPKAKDKDSCKDSSKDSSKGDHKNP